MALVYNPATYDDLPMLSEAGESFDTKQGEKLLEQFRTLFQSHGTDRTFGLILNHRHFDMASNERLVEYCGTSVPWQSLHDKTKPSTWFVSATGECSPYEFHYDADHNDHHDIASPTEPKYDDFVRSFGKLLHESNAEGLFGLCAYPGDDFEGRVEITAGRANINLHPEDAPEHMVSRPAAWFFSPVLYGRCTCICGGDGHTSATHRGHVPKRP